MHGLRGRRSDGRMDDKIKGATPESLSRGVCGGLGPTLASAYLADKHINHAGT